MVGLPLFDGIASLADTLIDRLVPDKAEAARIKADVAIKQQALSAELHKATLELAKEDAKSGKGGYRWGAGWLCVVSLGFAWVIHPLMAWLLLIVAPDVPPPPNIPVTEQYAMLTGMLGLAGIRAHDLLKGTRT